MDGRAAVLYDRLYARWLPRLYDAVAHQVAEVAPRGGTVLDVGTGPGRLLIALAGLRPDLTLLGVDPAVEMVSLARGYAVSAGVQDRVTVEVAAAERLPHATASIDVVVSTLSAHHWADRRAALAEQARVLRPGGRFIAYDLRWHGLAKMLDSPPPPRVDQAPLGLTFDGPPTRGPLRAESRGLIARLLNPMLERATATR